MDDASATPRLRVRVREVQPGRQPSTWCYQMRSRSPVTSGENYALKIAAGYVLHPSHGNDSYYFLLRL